MKETIIIVMICLTMIVLGISLGFHLHERMIRKTLISNDILHPPELFELKTWNLIDVFMDAEKEMEDFKFYRIILDVDPKSGKQKKVYRATLDELLPAMIEDGKTVMMPVGMQKILVDKSPDLFSYPGMNSEEARDHLIDMK